MQADRIEQALSIIRTAIGDRSELFASSTQLLAAGVDELQLDSLTKLQLVLDLETRFATMANESEIAACRTVGDLIELVSHASAVR